MNGMINFNEHTEHFISKAWLNMGRNKDLLKFLRVHRLIYELLPIV